MTHCHMIIHLELTTHCHMIIHLELTCETQSRDPYLHI